MIDIIFFAAAIIIAIAHFAAGKKPRSRERLVELLALYYLVIAIGLAYLFSAVGHIFDADDVARMIGWPVGSPFQFEVGLHDGAWGLLGVLCWKFRGNFWWATAIGYSFFSIGAGIGHVRDMLLNNNFAPYNAGMILPDIGMPLILFLLLFLNQRWNCAE